MFRHFLQLLVGIFLLGFGVQAFAAGKNPCPPIVPKTDMTYIKKVEAAMAMTNEAAKKAAIKKLQDTYSRDITKPERWSGCHTIRDTLTVDAPVTISAGSVLKFKANAGLQIGANGSLDATGTAKNPIVFTATDKTPGYWYGLFFGSKSSHNRLVHVKVLYAGGTEVGGNVTLRRPGGDNDPPSYAVRVKKSALLTVQHSVIAYSGGYGLESLGDLGKFTDNRIEHTKVPMHVRLDNVGHIAASNTFTDNGKQQIDVIGNETLHDDGTWQDLGVPYNLRYFVTIAANLKLAPGVVLRMGDGANFVVDGGEGASLNAVGTAAKPIVIRGWSKRPGAWAGLQINSHSDKNVFRFVKVADGGGDSPQYANIQDFGYLKIDHSWIENSKKVGIWVANYPSPNAVLEASNNTFKNVKINIQMAK